MNQLITDRPQGGLLGTHSETLPRASKNNICHQKLLRKLFKHWGISAKASDLESRDKDTNHLSNEEAVTTTIAPAVAIVDKWIKANNNAVNK